MADSRGQGNSTEGAGPITYGRLAFDAVRLLDHLGITRAHVVGHSSGGIAALYLLVHFPDRVKTATLMGTLYHVDNIEAIEQILNKAFWNHPSPRGLPAECRITWCEET